MGACGRGYMIVGQERALGKEGHHLEVSLLSLRFLDPKERIAISPGALPYGVS